jgi:hypothetical protein
MNQRLLKNDAAEHLQVSLLERHDVGGEGQEPTNGLATENCFSQSNRASRAGIALRDCINRIQVSR